MPSQLEIAPLTEPIVDPQTGKISKRWISWISQLERLVRGTSERWVTPNRPTADLFIGRSGFNTTLDVVEAWNGTEWVSTSNITGDVTVDTGDITLNSGDIELTMGTLHVVAGDVHTHSGKVVAGDNVDEDLNLLWVDRNTDTPEFCWRDNGEDAFFLSHKLDILGGIRTAGSGEYFLEKVLSIGDWDMDADAVKNVSHGLTLSKIRSVTALIIRDDSILWDDYMTKSMGETGIHGLSLTSSQVSFRRGPSGYFDNASYNATPFNRGYIYIKYVP